MNGKPEYICSWRDCFQPTFFEYKLALLNSDGTEAFRHGGRVCKDHMNEEVQTISSRSDEKMLYHRAIR